jgi:hypothetical protein
MAARVSALEGENYELQLRLQERELRLSSAESAMADLEEKAAEFQVVHQVLWEGGVSLPELHDDGLGQLRRTAEILLSTTCRSKVVSARLIEADAT